MATLRAPGSLIRASHVNQNGPLPMQWLLGKAAFSRDDRPANSASRRDRSVASFDSESGADGLDWS